MSKKTVASMWCMLRSNENIKLAIRHRMKEKNINQAQLSRMTGIPDYRISKFFRGLKNKSYSSVNQYQVLQICDALGIDVELKITFRNAE